MSDREDLERLATMHGSDKHGAHLYMQHYAKYFADFRNRPINLLEIGIGGFEDPNAGGSSLKVWRDYFPFGHIYGLDFFPKLGLEGDRIRTFQGSQVDPRTIATLLNAPKSKFDIIIDDGSHQNDHIILTFGMLFPHLKDGGLYVVEDVQTSYWPNYGGTSTNFETTLTAVGYFKHLVDGVNWVEHDRPGYVPRETDKTIEGIHFHHNLIFVEKGNNTNPSNIVQSNRLIS